ncbi:glycerophosphodiester phosphodiesterase [Novosphingobium flavum]|uniref:Glycerophosphodiester phosphodiesterase n=1 Tax=Novosphingobium flavum TaxID=1778672 RepID=A0A7X1KKZ7_9SPHN|nr:glycerophosphodiester phosphodiesterase family protein [Novosphingobium flavum]MBC2665066.1 glycerophosphodiester phosphodiesterase [Novosphingobium flavum]
MRLSLFALLDRWLAPAPAPARVGWLRRAIIAHRGLHGPGLPENGLGAAAAAIARGLGIECDVRKSCDGQAVVFHDAALDRLTGETGPLAERTAEQLGRVRLSGSEDTIPTLRRLLDLVAGQVPLLIEVKSDRGQRVEALCLAVRRVLEGYRGPHAVMSFDPRVSRWFWRHSPFTVRGLVMSEENEKTIFGRIKRHFSLWLARPDFLAYDIRDLPGRFPAAQRRRGLPLATWTVRSPDLLARALDHADAPTVEGAGVP